jgi:hypothetical protein
MKLKLLLLFIIIPIIFSCEVNTTSQADITSTDLVGTWNLTNFKIDNAILNILSPDPATITAIGFGKNYNASITFAENPNQVSVDGNFDFELTYTNGQTYTENIYLDATLLNNTFGSSSSSWQIDNNIVSLMESEEIINIEIIEYTGSKIVVETKIDQTITINNVTAEIAGKAFITLER